MRSLALALRRALLSLALLGAIGAPAQAQSLIRDAEIEETLRVYSDPLFKAANLNSDDVSIYILQDSTLNAFVTNGQNVFLHTGLILQAKTPNQLKGVIAHETGHISGGHLARSREAMQRSMTPAIVAIGLGVLCMAAGAADCGAALISGSQQFAMANFVRHTQVQESAADQAAVSFLDATGQSSRGLLEFFENFRYQEVLSEPRRNPYFRTHPLSSDRIGALRQRVEAAQHRDATDSEEDIRRFERMHAKLFGFLESPARTLARYPLSDTSVPARYARAVAAYRDPTKRDMGAALRETEALIKLEPENPYFQELMGQILFESGQASQSLPHHRRALELKPGNPLLEVGLARALISAEGEKGAPEAIDLLQKALHAEPDNVFAWRELASAHDMIGQDGLARLASAEQSFWLGDYPTAQNFAERAKRALPKGAASWQRASDISLASEAQIKGVRGGRG
jgi:predicted Zn-dependent protease